MKIFKWPSLLTVLLLVSCSKPLPTLNGIDGAQWAADRGACGTARQEMAEAIRREKDKLLALDQMQIVKLLGNPDQNELYARNQKFFYYFLEPGPSCDDGDPAALRLVIRFNALGLAKEISVE